MLIILVIVFEYLPHFDAKQVALAMLFTCEHVSNAD